MPEFIENPPIAENFMETARSFGNYDLALALADIIDNSISAGAQTIYIQASFDKDEIRISDDGSGMSSQELIIAMQFGSKNPKERRAKDDLGRFGLGLKTASFSQADKLTVLSSKDGTFCGAEWDQNDCADFRMKKFSHEESLEQINSTIATKNGTEVIWRELNRLRKGSNIEDAHEDFNRALVAAIDEIGLIFHRFLQGDNTYNNEGRVQVFLNNDLVEPIDPFCRSNPKTQRLSPNTETVGGEAITFTPFTLPASDELTPKEKKQLGGYEGFVKNAGFYIYRNKRLIIRGTWFKLVPYGELSKLSRVMVDIPNSIDEDWKITVDKSGVQLPSLLRKRLSGWLQKRIVPSSEEVFKGKEKKEKFGEPIWYYSSAKGVGRFYLEIKHPIFDNFSNKLDRPQQREFQQMLKVIEHLLPIHEIKNIVSDHSDEIFQGYTDTAPMEIKRMAHEIAIQALDKGKTKTEIMTNLKITQPFAQFFSQLEEYLDEKGTFGA